MADESILRGLIPQKFQRVDAIMELVDAIGEFQAQGDWQLLSALASQRYPEELDSNLLPFLASFLGFKFDADWFDQSMFVRMVQTVSQYYQYKGTADTFQYFGWLTDTVWTVKPLWTNDYNTFSIYPQNSPSPYEGTTLAPSGYASVGNGLGGWYQTPHVQLWFDADLYDPTKYDIKSMFLFMAPIQLVLDSVVSAFYGYMGFYLMAGGIESYTDGDIPDGAYGIIAAAGVEQYEIYDVPYEYASYVIQALGVEYDYY